MIDPLSIASDGQISSDGTTTSMSVATGGYIVEIEETVVTKPTEPTISFPSLGGGISRPKPKKKDDEEKKYKKIKIKVTMPDSTTYEKEFTLDPVELSVKDVSVDEVKNTISFSILAPHVKVGSYDDKKIIMELKNDVNIIKK